MTLTDQFSSVFQRFRLGRRRHISWVEGGCTCAAEIWVRGPVFWWAETTSGGGLGPLKFMVHGRMQFAFTQQQLGEPCLKLCVRVSVTEVCRVNAPYFKQ